MTELRLNGNDGEYLLFESLTGERYRVLVDDALRSAIRSHTPRNTTNVQLSPREIQSEIRSGKTVDELVAKSGDPRSYVEKFAAPVLDELTHVIASALGVRISIAGDRYTDISHIEFGEIISSRLEASGVSEFEWSAARDENQQWLVSVRFNRLGASAAATWSFDVKRLLLSPENELAVTLSTQNSISDANFARLKPAPEPEEQPAVSNLTESLADTQLVEPVIPIGRAAERVNENATVAEVIADEIPETADLLDALKKKREERSQRQVENPEPTIDTQTIDVVIEESVMVEPELGEESQLQPEDIEPRPAPTRRPGRPSIPSFDEIVQGTKSDED
ncbi:MAG: hypothetical protein RL149_982 [Actinomycetota bacterium]